MKRRVGMPAGEETDTDDDWDVGYQRRDGKGSHVSVPGSEEDPAVILKKAVSTGDAELVGHLLDSGVAVETRLGLDWTLLMGAVCGGHYKLAKLLLDRGAGANFSSDRCTVLMAACTASASEDQIVQCVELLLSRNADPNVPNKSGMTALMMAARDGYCQLINLLVSHGAKINLQDCNGYTALATAAQYGQENVVRKLLQLGADKSIKTREGRRALDVARIQRHTQISRLLMCSGDDSGDVEMSCKEKTLSNFFRQNPEPFSAPAVSSARLSDVGVLLHGLDLERLANLLDNDITWTDLSTMEKADLEKVGITNPEDQKKILDAVSTMNLDSIAPDALSQLGNIDSRSEDLYTLLVSLRQQCCCLTEVVQDALKKFPKQPSELILTLDPKRESQTVCSQLLLQIEDLQKEVTCMRGLFDRMDPSEDPCGLPWAARRGSWKRRVLMSCAVGVLCSGLICVLSHVRSPKVL
ncbi:ankyrin repeat, SAM and basic leucine zipper domain-containing protein 1 isoform X1 [Brienomyrus brachyistius]|uniref:ankyrin repeat, SAM and basic leucine zipper domain-containing protein 1 isoform X1 n=1 Tax=Brienomyrus brachyistius TaxID=42636 RepID=UPI0020B404B3|nr:ankyrin repeat, SAM and basic leucine zipper domain-containing protein 1 isoform X1 [Brienomyrus brachyistius]